MSCHVDLIPGLISNINLCESCSKRAPAMKTKTQEEAIAIRIEEYATAEEKDAWFSQCLGEVGWE